jgi:hypothetical protein
VALVKANRQAGFGRKIRDSRKTNDPRRIAEEAVGERPGSAIPEAAKQQVVRAPAASAGPQASLAARTAEAVGEREGGAYADGTIEEAQRRSRETVRRPRSSQAQATQRLSHKLARQPLMVISAAFALGYLAASVINHRR